MTESLKAAGRKLFQGGFLHIVGAGTLNKAIQTILSIVLVRALSQYDYGCYAYAFNIVSFFVIVNGLGASSAVLQICSEMFEDPERSAGVYAYGYKVSVAAGIVIAIAIFLASLFAPLGIPGSSPLLRLYSLYPLLLQLCDMKAMRLRIDLENREYALMTNVQTALLCAFSIAGALVGAAGLVVGQSLALCVAYAVLCIRHPFRRRSPRSRLSLAERKDYRGVALVSALNNCISQALPLLSTFFVGALMRDEIAVATFKVASTIPFALSFVPGAVVTYIYPHFARHKDDGEWSLRNFRRVILGSAAGMGLIALFFAAFAEPVVMLIFGSQYADAAPIMRVLMLGFFLSASFRQPAGNLLVTQRELLTNTVIGVASLAMCVVASMALIPRFGMLGAAAVYDACMFVGAAAAVPCYVYSLASKK